jgi:bifunctional non-homologous end joining protein LigD
VRFLDHIEERGEAFYAEVGRLKLEGLIAKRKDAPYRPGRSPHWLKLRTERVDDFVVVGFTEPQGARPGFGALHLAAFDRERLVYCGARGGSPRSARDAPRRAGGRSPRLARLQGRCRPTAAASGSSRGSWSVRYPAWTDEGLLRQPVFRGSARQDPSECVTRGIPTGQIPGKPGGGGSLAPGLVDRLERCSSG